MSAAVALMGETEDVAALAAATGVNLALSQAHAIAEASTPLEHARALADVIDAGTGPSWISDGTCGLQMSLEDYAHHCRKLSSPHDPDEVEVLREVIGRPSPERPSPLDTQHTLGRAVLGGRRARARQARAALMNDPDVRRRSAGIGGESKTHDEQGD